MKFYSQNIKNLSKVVLANIIGVEITPETQSGSKRPRMFREGKFEILTWIRVHRSTIVDRSKKCTERLLSAIK